MAPESPEIEHLHASWRRASETLSDEQRDCLAAAECLKIIDPRTDKPTVESVPEGSMAAIFVVHTPAPDDFAADGSPVSPASELVETPLELEYTSPLDMDFQAFEFPRPAPPAPEKRRPLSTNDLARVPQAPRERRVTFGTLPRPQLLRSVARGDSPTPSSWSDSDSDDSECGDGDGGRRAPPEQSKDGQSGKSRGDAVSRLRERLRAKTS